MEVGFVTSADAPALVALFARENAPCHCRYWHFAGTNKEWEARCALDPGANRAELETALAGGDDTARGLVARMAGSVVGWMKLAPRPTLAKLLSRPTYRDLPAPPDVWSIGCFLVDGAHRRRGVARALLEGAIVHAPRLGARILEAYPRRGDALHDGDHWLGPPALFEALGFEIVRDQSQYPVYRRAIDQASGSK